jgi:membrane-bound lytic murein transglycosylase D
MREQGQLPANPKSIRISAGAFLDGKTLQFTSTFRIGRTAPCEVCIRNDYVSRAHAEVTPADGGWRIRDLNSANGLFLDGVRFENAPVVSGMRVRLGAEGPELLFELPVQEIPSPAKRSPKPDFAADSPVDEQEIVSKYAERYFRDPQENEVMGEHTMYVRRAFAQVQTQQKRSHQRQNWILLGVIVLLVCAGIAVSLYAYRLHQERLQQRTIARNLFYAMKSLDVEIKEAEQLDLASGRQNGANAVRGYESRRTEIQANYDRFLSTLHVYDPNQSEQHRLILRIARVFGECELDMPPDFEQEVLKYIKYWQSSGRFARDIQTAKEKGYTHKISQALLDRGLPPQFFYLAMQESDFNPYISGPITRKGYAKGMWQFIPETAAHYGLRVGPLADQPRPDPADERDQVDKATDAATRYLNVLYSTDAQASGLLVMACYNWGEDQVLPLVRSMPANPSQRNFWRLLSEHRGQIPQQTYDYVFYITAAAVIGENPRLFGFNFDNPLDESAHAAI